MKSSDRVRSFAWRVALPLALSLSACVSPTAADNGTGGANGAGGTTSGQGGSSAGTGGTTGGGVGGSNVGTGGRAGTGTGGMVVTGGGGRGVGGSGVGGTPGVGGSIPNPDAGIRPDLNGRKALLVVESPSGPDDGETLVRQLLEIRGINVTLADPAAAVGMAPNFHVVILSSNLGSDVGASFKPLTVPIIAFGYNTYQGLGFTADNTSTSRGNTSATQVTIGDTSTQISSDLAMGSSIGVINSMLGNTQYNYGNPMGAAIKVASASGAPTQVIVFGYEKGASMFNGTAAARRVGIGWKFNAVKLLTTEAFKLQDGAISWTAGAP